MKPILTTVARPTVAQLPKTRRSIFHDATDFDVAILAELGWSTKAIARETGLSEGQVHYRIHFAGVKRADYRGGTSPTAQMVRDAVQKQVSDKVNDDILEKFEREYFTDPERVRKDKMSDKPPVKHRRAA